MRLRLRTVMIFSALLGLSSGAALADPSCSDWMKQSDGSWWRECVNDDGTTHCYSATDDTGANATEVSCSSS
jgi:hypothetical protein